MGTFVYASQFRAQFHDRQLRHLQIVVGLKFGRNQAFLFTWHPSKSMGAERITVWMNPSVPVQFNFDGIRKDPINRDWIDALTASANSPTGLEPLLEPVSSGNY